MSTVQRSSIAAGLVLAAAGAIAGYAWYRTLSAEPATSPQAMTWHKADGSPPTNLPGDAYLFDGCDGDMQLELAVWRGGVITSCDDKALGDGWVWLDPVARRAELRWPLPPGPRVSRTRGLIPGPGGALAIVFERALHGEIFVGIAAPHGWARAPESLGLARYRAAAWVGGRLEVVVTPVTAEDRYGMQQPHTIVAFEGGRRTERRGIAACAEPHCFTPSITYRAGGRWVFERAGRAVTETGEPATGVVPAKNDDYDVDLVAHGKLDVPTELALGLPAPVIGADGKAGTPPPPPWSELKITRQVRYEIDAEPGRSAGEARTGDAAIGHQIRRRPLWAADPGYRALVEQVGGRTLVWHTDDDDRVRIADALEALPQVKPAVRWHQGIAKRIIYPDPTGGYWMVDTDGRYIHLDGALRRTDPLPLREHLRRRGSLLDGLEEPEHERKLGWALFGLPLLLAAAYLIGALAAPPGASRWRPRVAPLAVVAGLYALSALLVLPGVLPLLV